MTLTIMDPGVGNLRSVQKGFERVGHGAVITADPEAVARAERLVAPGVGAFGDFMDKLAGAGLDEALRAFVATGRPLLGICVGLQALLTESEEFGPCAGLDLVPGRVVRLEPGPGRPVPHMGWNSLSVRRDHPVLGRAQDGAHVYFVHSFHAVPTDDGVVLATTDYGGDVVAAIARDNLLAVQFHPEKSQRAGLALLDAFARWDGRAPAPEAS